MAYPPEQSGLPPWLRVAAVWLAISLLDGSQSILWSRSAGRDLPWLPLYAIAILSWMPWALATSLISMFARRYPLAPKRWSTKALTMHAGVLVTLSFAASSWVAVADRILNPWQRTSPAQTFFMVWQHDFIDQLLTYLIVYSLIVAVTYVIDSHAHLARQRTEAARLGEQVSQAELATLRRQIEPHFLFNTLNSIVALVRDRHNDDAIDMIVRLSEFLRHAVENSTRPEVSLAEEVDYLWRYLEIQKVRFGERLAIEVDIPAELLRAQVPHLMLQPLAENGIKHGIARRAAGGALRISGARSGANVELRVYNDGPNCSVDADTLGAGVGLCNLRTRLQILHGKAASVRLRNEPPAGVEVAVILPFREGA